MAPSEDDIVETVASTRGVKLALHDFGGSGDPVLISHATGMNARAYEPLGRTLAASGFSVWALDLRGHGASTRPDDGDFAWLNMADDVLAAVDHLGVEQIFAVGHSMGGTSLLLAETKRPGTLAAAWLFEPIVFPAEIEIEAAPRNNILATGARKRRAEFPSKSAALERYASRPPLNILRADALAGYVDGGFVDTGHGTVELSCRPADEAETFEHAGTPATAFAGVTTPVVVASGPLTDEPGAADFAAGAAAALPNGEHVVFDHLGHFGPLQDPDLIAREAAAFFRS